MNFEHTEDRRMLADTLNRFVAEQYGIETRNHIAYGDNGMDALRSWVRLARCSLKPTVALAARALTWLWCLSPWAQAWWLSRLWVR